ncbi:MAG: aminotransferase class IV [Chlamydiae bacterium]|nr:aminotransferase class IV [Chlamydiota bacterium]MBI3277586.1 aminotransferase class IV [Chlamydiota bacterium]
MSQNLIYFNNRFFKENEAPELILDRGLFFGDGIFESLRFINEKAIGLEAHIQRLFYGMEILKIEPAWKPEEILSLINKTVLESGLDDCYIRLSVTRGKWMGSIPPIVSGKPNLIIISRKFLPFREEIYERGYRTLTLPIRRNETSPLSQIKSLNYLDNILGRMEALEKEVDEGIFLNTKNGVTEGTASNLFLIQGKKLITPPQEDGILGGITRKIILERCPSLDLKPEIRSIHPDEIIQANEAFLTNALMGIVPWVESNGKKIGSGKPGPLTQSLRSLYKKLLK